MKLMQGSQLIIFTAAQVLFLVWLAFLTYQYYTVIRQYKKLEIGEEKSLINALEKIFDKLDELYSKEENLFSQLNNLKSDSLKHVQRVAVKRFNPFGDTGSDQSFSLALLSEKGDGVVLSSLHGRSGTRVYAKPVKSAKQDIYELSVEEEDVIKEAMKL